MFVSKAHIHSGACQFDNHNLHLDKVARQKEEIGRVFVIALIDTLIHFTAYYIFNNDSSMHIHRCHNLADSAKDVL